MLVLVFAMCCFVFAVMLIAGIATLMLAGVSSSWHGYLLCGLFFSVSAGAYYVARLCKTNLMHSPVPQPAPDRPYRETRTLQRVPKRSKATTLLLILAVSFVVSRGIKDAIRIMGLHLNTTDSIPVGLYRDGVSLTAAAGTGYRGSALFCLPTSAARLALSGDLPIAPGYCNGYQDLVKPIYEATPERPIRFAADGFYVAGKRIKNTVPRGRAHSGKMIDHYPFGVYESGLWAISDFNPNSYDSRYFGPIQESDVRAWESPVITLNQLLPASKDHPE